MSAALQQGSHDRRALAPDYTANASVSYVVPGTAEGDPLGEWTLSVNYGWRSRAELAPINNPQLSQPSFGLLNARIDIAKPGGSPITFSVFAKNLTDEKYLTAGVPLVAFGYFVAYTGPRRFIGAEARIDF